MLKRIKSTYIKYTLLFIAVFSMGFLLFFASVYFGGWGEIPNKKELAGFQYQRASEVYSAR